MPVLDDEEMMETPEHEAMEEAGPVSGAMPDGSPDEMEGVPAQPQQQVQRPQPGMWDNAVALGQKAYMYGLEQFGLLSNVAGRGPDRPVSSPFNMGNTARRARGYAEGGIVSDEEEEIAEPMVSGVGATPEDYSVLAAPETEGAPEEQGNIDLNTRPKVKNPDGTVSTIKSMSVNMDGQEVLIPTISDDGQVLSADEAVDLYKRTGRHLGKFRTPDEATRYAKSLSESQGQRLGATPERDLSGAVEGSVASQAADYVGRHMAGKDDGTRLPEGESGLSAVGGYLGGTVGGENIKRFVAYLKGEGTTAPAPVVARYENLADPDRALPPKHRNLAALELANMEGGLGAASSLLNSYRLRSESYRTFALAALEGGRPTSMADAARAASQAYSQLPNGIDVQFAPAPGGFHVKVLNGEQAENYVISADRFKDWLTRDSQWDKQMMQPSTPQVQGDEALTVATQMAVNGSAKGRAGLNAELPHQARPDDIRMGATPPPAQVPPTGAPPPEQGTGVASGGEQPLDNVRRAPPSQDPNAQAQGGGEDIYARPRLNRQGRPIYHPQLEAISRERFQLGQERERQAWMADQVAGQSNTRAGQAHAERLKSLDVQGKENVQRMRSASADYGADRRLEGFRDMNDRHRTIAAGLNSNKLAIAMAGIREKSRSATAKNRAEIVKKWIDANAWGVKMPEQIHNAMLRAMQEDEAADAGEGENTAPGQQPTPAPAAPAKPAAAAPAKPAAAGEFQLPPLASRKNGMIVDSPNGKIKWVVKGDKAGWVRVQ